MGGCQYYGPFLGYPKYKGPYYNRDPKRDHKFDNQPYIYIYVQGLYRGGFVGIFIIGVYICRCVQGLCRGGYF